MSGENSVPGNRPRTRVMSSRNRQFVDKNLSIENPKGDRVSKPVDSEPQSASRPSEMTTVDKQYESKSSNFRTNQGLLANSPDDPMKSPSAQKS